MNNDPKDTPIDWSKLMADQSSKVQDKRGTSIIEPILITFCNEVFRSNDQSLFDSNKTFRVGKLFHLMAKIIKK